VRATVQRFAAALDESGRAAAWAELARLEAELLGRFEAAGRESGGRAFAPALYRLFAARGELDRAAGDEAREAWLREAEAFADLSLDAETSVRARLLRGTLLLETARVRDALELTGELLEGFPAVRLRPFVLYQRATACDALGEYTPALDLLDELERTLPEEPWAAQLRCQVPALRAQVYSGVGVVDLAARSVRAGRECLEGLDAVGANHAILMDVQTLNVELARGRSARVVELAGTWLADERRYPPGSRWRGSLLGARGEAELELAREEPARSAAARALLEEALACDLSQRDRLRVEVLLAQRALDEREVARAAEHLRAANGLLEGWRARARSAGPVPEELLLATAAAGLALARPDERDALLRAREALQAALERRMTTWDELAPLRQGGSGFLQDPGTLRGLAELSRLLLRLEGAAGAAAPVLELWPRVQALGSIARARGLEALSLGRLRTELLAGGHGLLAYLPGPSASLVLVLDRERAELVELVAEHALGAQRERLQRARATGDPAGAARAAHDLARLLFPPEVEAALARWSAVTIAGADLLGEPPFTVLPLAGGELLGTARALDFLPSLPLGYALARRTGAFESRGRDLFVVAAPRIGTELRQRFTELDPLPASGELARAFDFAPQGGAVRRLLGVDATHDNVRAALAEAFGLVFLTHCVQDERLERPSALVLSPALGQPELLGCDDVEAVAAPPLVFLGACRAARGPLRRGDEATGHLGGAFLRAGSRAVVLSSDELEFEAARRISAGFLERVCAHGESPAEALRAALKREHATNPREVPLRGAHLLVLGLGQRPLLEVDRTARAESASSAPSAAAGRGALEWAVIYCAALALCLGVLAGWARVRSR
jgi:hypothetical protein